MVNLTSAKKKIDASLYIGRHFRVQVVENVPLPAVAIQNIKIAQND